MYSPSRMNARCFVASRLLPLSVALRWSALCLSCCILLAWHLLLFSSMLGFSLHSIRRSGAKLSYKQGGRDAAISALGHNDRDMIDTYWRSEDRQAEMGWDNILGFVGEVS